MLRYEVSAVQASARALVRVGHPPDISQPERGTGWFSLRPGQDL